MAYSTEIASGPKKNTVWMLPYSFKLRKIFFPYRQCLHSNTSNKIWKCETFEVFSNSNYSWHYEAIQSLGKSQRLL